jgi:hypothetical protein
LLNQTPQKKNATEIDVRKVQVVVLRAKKNTETAWRVVIGGLEDQENGKGGQGAC